MKLCHQLKVTELDQPDMKFLIRKNKSKPKLT